MERNFRLTCEDTGGNAMEAIPFQTRPSENFWLLSEALPCLVHFLTQYLAPGQMFSQEEMQKTLIETEVLKSVSEVIGVMTKSAEELAVYVDQQEESCSTSTPSTSTSTGTTTTTTTAGASSTSSTATSTTKNNSSTSTSTTSCANNKDINSTTMPLLSSVAEAKKVVEEKLLRGVNTWNCTTIKEHDARFKIWKSEGKSRDFFNEQITKHLKPESSWGPFEHFQKFDRFLEMELLMLDLVSQEAVTKFADLCKPIFKTPIQLMQQTIMDDQKK